MIHCNEKVDLIPDASEIAELGAEVCPVDWAKRCVAIARHENDGLSVMCRDGMTQLLILIGDVTGGKAASEDLDIIKDLCAVISETKGCELSRKAAANVLYSMDRYADDWDQHCRRKRCSHLVCEAYYSVYIDPAVCQACHDCVKAAPAGAIASGDGMISVIVDDSALKDAAFIASCPKGAIKKAGAVKPRVPEAPIPVGSFGGESAGGRRRRRG